jgi:hypothetical protein
VMNFDLEFTTEDPVLTPIDSEIDIIDQSEFDGFSFYNKIFEPERRKSLTLKTLTNLKKRKLSVSMTAMSLSKRLSWRRTSDPQDSRD